MARGIEVANGIGLLVSCWRKGAYPGLSEWAQYNQKDA